MTLNTPNTGERILPWAREATREINANRPTAGKGISITKTNNGTTFSLDKKSIAYPDSAPPVIAGQLSENGDKVLPEDAFATTYSIEKNEQNAFSLFGFSDIPPLSDNYHYSLDELSNHVDLVLRDTTHDNAVLSSPTVRYSNVLCLLVNAVSENDLSGDNPIRDSLSVVPDSEIKEPITYSIQHNENNEGELELYKFHDHDYKTDFATVSANSDIVIRRKRHTTTGNIHEVSYLPLSAIPFGEGGGYPLDGVENDIARSLNLNSEDEAQIYGFEDGTPVANGIGNSMFIIRAPGRRPRVEYTYLSTIVSEISSMIPTDGFTGDVPYVISSSYSTSTHKFLNHMGQMHFENGLLKWNSETGTQEVFTAVEEEL